MSERAAPSRMRGTMLWFNAAKDLGALQTDAGERMDVPATAFDTGEKPVGRCAGKPVEFACVAGGVSEVRFVSEGSARRARLRHRR
jgi:cold shock CspA family protein